MRTSTPALHAALCVALSSFAPFAVAAPTTVSISAAVTYVDDRAGLLGNSIVVGSRIGGSYAFDSSTPDTNSAGSRSAYVGDYWHYSQPYGISLFSGGLVFQTDPNRVNFVVEVVDGGGSSPYDRDNYLLRSYTNLPLNASVQVGQIAWQLDDPTGTALTGDRLPLGAPNLASFQSIFGLTLEGGTTCYQLFCFGDDRFFVRAVVDSVSVVPPQQEDPIDKPGVLPANPVIPDWCTSVYGTLYTCRNPDYPRKSSYNVDTSQKGYRFDGPNEWINRFAYHWFDPIAADGFRISLSDDSFAAVKAPESDPLFIYAGGSWIELEANEETTLIDGLTEFLVFGAGQAADGSATPASLPAQLNLGLRFNGEPDHMNWDFISTAPPFGVLAEGKGMSLLAMALLLLVHTRRSRQREA